MIYRVNSKVYDKHVEFNMEKIHPQDKGSYVSERHKDEYNDFFDTEKKAKDFMAQESTNAAN